MAGTTGIIVELCKHEYLQARRDAHFRRNCMIWILLLILWCCIAVSLSLTLQEYEWDIAEHLPLFIILDQAIRLVSQKTPNIPLHTYSLLPIRRWQVILAYVIRMTFTPATLVWIPAMWQQWWYLGIFVLSGYIYLAWWHGYRYLSRTCTGISYHPLQHANGLLACEMKMRARIPSLRHKIRNGAMGAMVLLCSSLVVKEQTYMDFAILYTLLFPSLPLMVSRLGYEQAYMGLLSTRMHSLVSLYVSKYMASLLLLVPCFLLLYVPAYMGMFSVWRLGAWTLTTALVIYPTLLLTAPQSRIDSPSTQMVTIATMILPPLTVKIISYITTHSILFL